MARNSGPAGTGLIPPGAPGSDENPAPNDSDNPPPDPDVEDTPPPSDVVPSNVDDVPPVPDSDRERQAGGNSDEDDDDEFIDPEQFRNELLDEVQRRFDRAISRVTRSIQDQPPRSTGGGGDDDDDESGNPPPPAARRGRQVDTMSIRSYARGVLNDEMENAGRAERQAVRSVLDNVLLHVDWSTVSDEEEYVDELVRSLASTSQSLIKVGSDRKVAQLRQSGLLPKLNTQPGSAAPPTHSASTGMAKGAAVGQKRWPSGRRRMTG